MNAVGGTPMARSRWRPNAAGIATGAFTNFFDTLGIGSFAVTTAISRAWRLTDDALLPGSLNVGHALPILTQALIFIRLVRVERSLLVGMLLAACAGAWRGAAVVARLPRRRIQQVMGGALLVAAGLLLATLLHWVPGGGEALGLHGVKFGIALAGNFVLGALMTAGIGLYAPCMILVYLLGMTPAAAFPIMMGSCALLMPVASVRFLREDRVDRRFAAGLTLGGIPAVLVAAFAVTSLPLDTLRWLVLAVVSYTAVGLLRSAAVPDAGVSSPA